MHHFASSCYFPLEYDDETLAQEERPPPGPREEMYRTFAQKERELLAPTDRAAAVPGSESSDIALRALQSQLAENTRRSAGHPAGAVDDAVVPRTGAHVERTGSLERRSRRCR